MRSVTVTRSDIMFSVSPQYSAALNLRWGEAVRNAGTARGRRVGAIVLAIIFAVIAVLAAVAAIIYYTKTSQSLPGFLPGRRLGVTGHDTTRGLAAIIVAAVALLVVSVSLGNSRPSRKLSAP